MQNRQNYRLQSINQSTYQKNLNFNKSDLQIFLQTQPLPTIKSKDVSNLQMGSIAVYTFISKGYGIRFVNQLFDCKIGCNKYTNYMIGVVLKALKQLISILMKYFGNAIQKISKQDENILRTPLLNCWMWMPQQQKQTFLKIVNNIYRNNKIQFPKEDLLCLYSLLLKQLEKKRNQIPIKNQQFSERGNLKHEDNENEQHQVNFPLLKMQQQLIKQQQIEVHVKHQNFQQNPTLDEYDDFLQQLQFKKQQIQAQTIEELRKRQDYEPTCKVQQGIDRNNSQAIHHQYYRQKTSLSLKRQAKQEQTLFQQYNSNQPFQVQKQNFTKLVIDLFVTKGYGLPLFNKEYKTSVDSNKYINCMIGIVIKGCRSINEILNNICGRDLKNFDKNDIQYLRSPLLNCWMWMPNEQRQTFFQIIKNQNLLQIKQISKIKLLCLYACILKQLRKRKISNQKINIKNKIRRKNKGSSNQENSQSNIQKSYFLNNSIVNQNFYQISSPQNSKPFSKTRKSSKKRQDFNKGQNYISTNHNEQIYNEEQDN